MNRLAIFLWGAALAAQTVITDTVRKPDGTVFQGNVSIQSPELTWNNQTYARATLRYNITQNGILSVSLVPNVGALPEGTSYRVQYEGRDGSRYVEWWVVPSSASPLLIHQVRRGSSPAWPTTNIAPFQISGARGFPGKVLCSDGDIFTLCSGLTDPTTFRGDIAYRGASAIQRLGVGAPGTVLTSNGVEPTWQTPAGGTGGQGIQTYSQTFTSQTSLTISAAAHGFSTANLFVTIYDGSGVQLTAAVTVNPSTFAVGVTFTEAQTGRVLISKAPAFSTAFTSQTSVVITGGTHGLATQNLSGHCYDGSGNLIGMAGFSVNPSTFNATFTFTEAQTGRCFVAGGA